MNALEYMIKTHKKNSKEVAELIGVAPQTFNDWVRGRRKVPNKRLKQLSEIFSVNEDLILKDEVDLAEIDKLQIYLAYLKKVNTYQYDPEIHKNPHFSHAIQIRQISILIENQVLITDIQKLIEGGGIIEDENYSIKSVKNYFIFRKITDLLMDEENNAKVLTDLKQLLNIK